MENDSGGAEWDLSVLLRRLGPVEDRFDVLLLYAEVITVADGRLEEDADGVGQLGCERRREAISQSRGGSGKMQIQESGRNRLNVQMRESASAGSL